MDSDQGKLFIGGISWETTEEKLRDYFKAYGEVTETVIMKDRATGRARGFGFVIFADPAVADRVVNEKHTIDGRTVEAKKAVPRDEQQQNVPRSSSGGQGPAASHTRTKKIFVGGLASTVTEDDFRNYFAQFGTITDVVVMYDHNTQRPRGFGFITFDSEDAVDNVLLKPFHELNEKMVEVKRAVPKELSVAAGRNNSGGGGYGGAGYGNSPVGGGYGGGGGYGTAGAGSGGYGSGPVGGRSPWGSGGGGYGTGGSSGGYGGSSGGSMAGYGNAAWGSGGAGAGQATGSSAGYGSSGYGYGSNESGYGSAAGYGGRGSGYGTGSSGYGTAAGGTGSGSYGGGYGDMYTSGYADNTWRSAGADAYNTGSSGSGVAASGGYGMGAGAAVAEGAGTGSAGYGGGYGVAGRQTQRGSDARFRPYPADGDRTG
ncbi:unnamed protein product [Sphagnum jensenii]|uniref:RRM domain-containing protein n=1 Tax=Sphagnum jensenii TaxID=128206 RepID=A0ABP1BWW0_9BRYO